MELINENLEPTTQNIDSFSKSIGYKWNIASDTLKNYILANISVFIVRNTELKKNINKLYFLDKIKYYNAAINSSCINHIIMTQGTLEQEIEGRKALGILLIAEHDHNLRNSVISLLRKSYPVVFNAVKKHDKRELVKMYIQIDEVTRITEARLHGALYFYFAIYRFCECIDQGFLKSIIDDMKFFEFYDPMTRVIDKELILHKSELQEIKSLLKKEYGKINSYKDILNSGIEDVSEFGSILENLFIINKLDINHLFYNSNFLNIDEIILSYIKRNNGNLNLKVILQTIINGIFIKSLINEYKKSRTLYFDNNQETMVFRINSLEEELSEVEEENIVLSTKITSLEQEKYLFDGILNNEKNSINKKHKSEVLGLQNTIKELQDQVLLERKYRDELNELREYIFKVDKNYIPPSSNKTLDYYIARKKLLIIGGTREWRRRFREKYPELRTLTGFNGTFDTNILINYDYVFFYTGFMDHATYYRAINFIRAHQIKFGYIGKTNIDLVEYELIDELGKNILN
ncbi:MAG TPA: hypothetical protein VIK26_01045 [Clostridium sp.]